MENDTKYRSIESDLYNRWLNTCERLMLGQHGVQKALTHQGIGGWFNVLVNLYTQPHRSYHTLAHVQNLLDRLQVSDADAGPMTGPREDVGHALDVTVAIWFHDAIYLPGSKDNERQSANLAASFLATMDIYRVDEQFCDSVFETIMATKHDGDYLQHASARLMCDLDLAGFADPWDKFEANNERVRAEFKHVTPEQYRTGRLKFLSGLLARDHIFHALHDLETPARANIERHMADLLKS